MVNTTFKILLGVLFLSLLFLHQAAGAKLSRSGNATEVNQVVGDLKSTLAKIEEYKAKSNQAQVDLESKVLVGNDRQTTDNEAMMDGSILDNFRAAAWNDIGYLKGHWSRLSGDDKSLVDQALLDLDETD